MIQLPKFVTFNVTNFGTITLGRVNPGVRKFAHDLFADAGRK